MSGLPQHRAVPRARRLKMSLLWYACILALLPLALIVLPVQAAWPIANDDSATVDEDSLNNRIDVLANDSDPDGDTLTIVAVTQGLIGDVVIIDARTRVSYTPKPGLYGDDYFTYVVDDGKGGTDTARVDVTVKGINDPPIAQDDEAATDEDTPITIDVLDNDTDSDGNLDRSTVRRVSGPSHGSTSVDSTTGEITYRPAENWYGDDSFTYEVCDDGTPLPPRCDRATVSVTVREVNDPPVANAGPDQSVKTNAIVTLDGGKSTDPEDDLPLTYSWNQTGGPPVFLNSPSAQSTTFVARDNPCVLTFELQVIDSRGSADLTPDEIVVTVTNQAPIAHAGADQNVPTDAVVRLDGTGSYDPDNDTPLTFLWSQTDGPVVTLSSATIATPTFTAPSNPAVLAFALYVIDSLQEPDLTPDTVKVTVYERPVYHVYMPALCRNYAVAPDLVVQSIQATRNNVRLVIANQGNMRVQNGFFVDVYINPSPAPTRVNQTWLDLARQGMVWGVSGSALQALAPGASITLEYGDSYYLPEYSSFSGSLAPGTPIYAQVDSYNDPDTGYGTVRETHEMLSGPYNNILGPVYSTAAFSESPLSHHPTDPGWKTEPSGQSWESVLDSLPPRP